MRNKKKVILPPMLPPEVSDDDIVVSDEDTEFVSKNKDFAGFLSKLDTTSITKHVSRVADANEETVEAKYEERRKKTLLKEKEGASGIEVDPVDALPIKDLSGNLHYLKAPKNSKPDETDPEGPGLDDEVDPADKGIVKLNKAERRAKLKKQRKEAKKHGKDSATPEIEAEAVAEVEAEPTPQAAVLDEVKKDLTAEEGFESKKHKLAELGMAIQSDPEANIKFLKDMLQICKDKDHAVVKLGLLSCLAAFKELIPGYRIRLPTEKELEMKVSKEVKKMRLYESTLLNSYKAYLQMLAALEKQPSFQHVAFFCICTLLDAVPYFNYREDLLGIVVRNISSSDDVVRKRCCSTVKSLFTNEGKHGGEVTVEAVRLIANYVKARNCQMHPDSIEVFLSLSFYEDLGRASKEDKNKVKNKKGKKRKDTEDPRKMKENDKKRSRKEQLNKTKEEVDADYKAVAYTPDVMERRRMQTETLSAVFEIYFRILKHTTQSSAVRSEANLGASEPYPLLAPCLQGLGKFSHLIDLDFMGDLIKSLRKLASGSGDTDRSSKCLTVSERLRCCIVAFKVMKSNLDALNVDLQDFFIQLYNIILEYRPGRDQGEVLAEALKVMLCEDRQHDMQKAAAFVKRFATFALCFGCAESMAALVTLKHLLLKNAKCRNLLENDAGGGSVSGLIAKYHPEATDPNLSGALASVLWELNLLSKHYHPGVSTMAASISSMNTAHSNQVYLSTMTPQQAFTDFSLEKPGSFKFQGDIRKSINKRKRGTGSCIIELSKYETPIDEDEVKKKLSAHFRVLRDIKENQRLRAKLQSTTSSIQLYDEYKKQKQKVKKPQTKKSKILTK